MKCKTITGNKDNLEDLINDWLKSGKYSITHTSNSQSSIGYITVVIFYDELKEVRRKKLDKLNQVKKK